MCSIEKYGLVWDWNQTYPACAIEAGDRIVSVNGLCYPEVVLEQLAAEVGLKIVVEKKGGLAGALVPHTKFTIELKRMVGETFGFEVNPDTMEVLRLKDDGKAAQWNRNNPFRCIVVGDRLVDVNGVHTAMNRLIEDSLELYLVVARGSGAAFGTFGVKLKVTDKLGFGLSQVLEVETVEAGGALQQWNGESTINRLRLGDRLLQVNGKTSPATIFFELKEPLVTLVVARAERRVDPGTGSILTLKECHAEWKDADERWKKMQPMSGQARALFFCSCWPQPKQLPFRSVCSCGH